MRKYYPYIILLLMTIGGCNSETNTNGESAQGAQQNAAVRENDRTLPRSPGVPIKFTEHVAQESPQSDEWNLDDKQGKYDHLIPVVSSYPLPEVPSRLHDVATIRGGHYLRPRIPSARTTVDGRLGVSFMMQRKLEGDSRDGIGFMLFTPEKLREKGVHYTQASDGSTDLMSKKTVWISFNELVPKESQLEPVMNAVCDSTMSTLNGEVFGTSESGIHRNPYRASSTADGYDIHILSWNAKNRREIFSFPVRVIVENAKTTKAYIKRVEKIGPPLRALLPFEPITLFEPNITGDGRLLVYRVSGTPGQGGGLDSLSQRTWIDNQGRRHKEPFDIVYAFNSPASGYAPCDPRGWTNPRPITYAHYDSEVQSRYGFAKFPFRDPEGKSFRPGEESGMTYPWMDHRGANLFFTSVYRMPISDESTYLSNEDFEMFQSLDNRLAFLPSLISSIAQPLMKHIALPSIRPHLMMPKEHIISVPGECSNGCDDSTAREHVSSTRGIGVAGLWTQGKMVLLDGMINATDYGFLGWDSGHRLMRLYHGKGGVVRVGNGRTNIPLKQGQKFDEYWPQNDSMIESLENKLNMFPEMKPADPRDVVWTINNGRASTEIAFDDFMDNNAVVLSTMVPSLSHNPYGPIKWLIPNTGDRLGRPIRLQNAATNDAPAIPKYGEIVGNGKGGTRIEPVALGGIDGKGLWLNEDTGIVYTVGTQPLPTSSIRPGVYIGMFIDLRGLPNNEGLILTTPKASLKLRQNADKRLTLVVLTSAGKNVELVDLPLELASFGKYFHLAINGTPANLEILVNGFVYRSIQNPEVSNDFLVRSGKWIVGYKPDNSDFPRSSDVKGFRGWVDNIEIFNRALVDAEEGCNRAYGSIVEVDAQSRVVKNYPVEAQQKISRLTGRSGPFECKTSYSEEGFGFLSRLPKSVRVGAELRAIKPLRFGLPRPNELDNAFCVNCHRSPHPSRTMSLDALSASNLPMHLDPRRQPLQPYPLATGAIPHGWPLNSMNDGQKGTLSENQELWIDSFLFK